MSAIGEGRYNPIMNWRERITVNPEICHGKACVKDTRVMALVILDNLAAGETPNAIAAAYRVQPQDIRAALAYAAELARERAVPIASGVCDLADTTP